MYMSYTVLVLNKSVKGIIWEEIKPSTDPKLVCHQA